MAVCGCGRGIVFCPDFVAAARGSCSTMLFTYFDWRISTGGPLSALDARVGRHVRAALVYRGLLGHSLLIDGGFEARACRDVVSLAAQPEVGVVAVLVDRSVQMLPLPPTVTQRSRPFDSFDRPAACAGETRHLRPNHLGRPIRVRALALEHARQCHDLSAHRFGQAAVRNASSPAAETVPESRAPACACRGRSRTHRLLTNRNQSTGPTPTRGPKRFTGRRALALEPDLRRCSSGRWQVSAPAIELRAFA